VAKIAKQVRKIGGKCKVTITEIGGRVTMRCKNLARKPTEKEVEDSAQSILDSVKNNKIIYK
jgi:hypothetical protein